MTPASLPLLLLLLCAAARVPVVLGLQCYVCVPHNDPNITDVQNVFPKFPANLTCESFTSNSNNNNNKYIRNCPDNHSGCIMITDGSKVTRSCAEFLFSECKMANSVEYCYCKDSLCNGVRAARHPIPATLPPPPPSDDEDLEGSGGGPVDGRKSLTPTTTTTTKQTPVVTPRSAAKSTAGPRHTPLHRTVPLVLLLVAATANLAH